MTDSDKQQAILKATLALIAEHGFHGTSVSMIVKASRVSTGIIYHYFQSKDEIIEALYRSIKREFGQAVVVDLDVTASWRDRSRHIWLRAFHFYAAHPIEARFLEQYENSPYHQKGEQSLQEETLGILGQMFIQDIAQGHVKPLPTSALYALTFRVAQTMAKAYNDGEFTADSDTLDRIAEACYRAVST